MMYFGNWNWPRRTKHFGRQIGEQFDYKGVKLEVVEVKEDPCEDCYFRQNCKKIKFILSLGTRIKDIYFLVGREDYSRCKLDDKSIEITGECSSYYREDDKDVTFKKVE